MKMIVSGDETGGEDKMTKRKPPMDCHAGEHADLRVLEYVEQMESQCSC